MCYTHVPHKLRLELVQYSTVYCVLFYRLPSLFAPGFHEKTDEFGLGVNPNCRWFR